MGQKAKYLLPLSNDFNVEYACLPVPIDINHRAAFWGQIYALGSARVWADDDAHSALDAAGVWQNIAEQVTFANDCNPFECPDGITLEIDPDDEDNTSGTIHDVVSWNCPEPNVDVMIARVYGSLLGFAHQGFRLRQGGVTIGAEIPAIRVFTFNTSPGNHIIFTYKDCLDNVNSVDYGPGVDEAAFDGYEVQTFNIETTDSYFMVVTMPREVLCSPA